MSKKDPSVIDIVPRRKGEEDMPRERLAEMRENPLEKRAAGDEAEKAGQQETGPGTLTPPVDLDQDRVFDRMSAEPRPLTRFTVINARTGERVGTIRKSTLDRDALRELFPDHPGKNMRIEKIVWADYDEVEVYVIGWQR